MSDPTDAALLDAATEMAREAGEITLRWFRSSTLAVERKSDGSPVTAADKASERFLREEIGRRFPDDGIIGEEEGTTDGTSGRTWVIDPLDGTKAFTHGIPLYTNLLAVLDGSGPVVGVINVPAQAETIAAARGLGCTCNGAPASVSATTSVDGAYLSSSGFDYWPEDQLLRLKRAGLQMRTWGDGYGYALVATGRIDAMADPLVAQWDLAPMATIMAEAGGRFTDFRGEATALSGNGLATNGAIHDEVLALLDH